MKRRLSVHLVHETQTQRDVQERRAGKGSSSQPADDFESEDQVNTFTVANRAQQVIFEHELKGQLSDGHWENSTPHNHWRNWCDAEVKVGENIGRNFYARRKYNFLNPDLLDVVQHRMRLYVMIDKAFGEAAIKPLEYLFESINDRSEACPIEYKGMPKHDGEYWDGVRDNIIEFVEANGGLPNVVKVVLDQTYTVNNLREDLRQIQAASRTELLRA